MRKHVLYLDHNVWDHLHRETIDLRALFPAETYTLAITREAEFEVPPTPLLLRDFIVAKIAAWDIITVTHFGFADERHPPAEQRVAGFDQGTWASQPVLDFLASQHTRIGNTKKPKTRLFKHEADVALGAHTWEGVVLTFDEKPGPLRDAAESGGLVVFLGEWPATAYALRFAVHSTISMRAP